MLNRCLENYLRCYMSDHPKQWSRFLPWAMQLRQRLLRHCMEGLHLFSTLYIEEFICRGGQAAVDGLGWGCAIVEISPRSCLDKDDDTLWLGSKGSGFCSKGHGLSKDSAIPSLYFASPANQILAVHFYNPFKILERIGEVAYHLELPEGVTIHPIFHVSRLKARVRTSNLFCHDLLRLERWTHSWGRSWTVVVSTARAICWRKVWCIGLPREDVAWQGSIKDSNVRLL